MNLDWSLLDNDANLADNLGNTFGVLSSFVKNLDNDLQCLSSNDDLLMDLTNHSLFDNSS